MKSLQKNNTMLRKVLVVLISLVISALCLFAISILQVVVGTSESFFTIPINGLTAIFAFIYIYNLLVKRWFNQVDIQDDTRDADEKIGIDVTGDNFTENNKFPKIVEITTNTKENYPGGIGSTESSTHQVRAEQPLQSLNTKVNEDAKFYKTQNKKINMKKNYKIVVAVVLIGTIIISLYGIDDKFKLGGVDGNDYLFSFLDDYIDILIVIISFLVIFMTITVLVSPNSIIKSSPEVLNMKEEDILLQTKLSVLKKEKELLEIQKDIDSLRSASSPSKSL